MKVAISEARKRLPALVRRVRSNPGERVQITLHDEIVAELCASQPEPAPGAAANKLLEMIKRLPKPRGRKTDVSRRIKAHLYKTGTSGGK